MIFLDLLVNAGDLLGCECTLLAHLPVLQALLHRAVLDLFILQIVLTLGTSLTQMLNLGPHGVPMSPPLELVQILLRGIKSLRHVNCTTQLGKLAEDALGPTIHSINKDIKQYLVPYGPVMDTTCD